MTMPRGGENRRPYWPVSGARDAQGLYTLADDQQPNCSICRPQRKIYQLILVDGARSRQPETILVMLFASLCVLVTSCSHFQPQIGNIKKKEAFHNSAKKFEKKKKKKV